MPKDFSDIEAAVKSRCKQPKRVMIIGTCFSKWMRTLRRAADEGLVEPLLVGNQVAMRENADIHGIDISDFRVEHVIGGAVELAVQVLKAGEVDVLVRGDVGVLDLLSALFKKESGFRRSGRFISGISAHFVGSLGRLLFVTDPIVAPAPDLGQKIALIENGVGYLRELGFVRPNVALTAAVEAIYPAMQHTVEAAVIAKMNDRGQIRNCLVDGPLSMDTAVVQSAAEDKGVRGPVAGRADLLVQPNIETSYGMYKAFVHYVKAPTGVVVIGGKVPVCVTSRADSVQTNYNSLLMALV